jgi:hypothetical protein
MKKKDFAGADISRIIEMAWEDRTPFEVILEQYKLSEPQVIKIMRSHMKPHVLECGANVLVEEKPNILACVVSKWDAMFAQHRDFAKYPCH